MKVEVEAAGGLSGWAFASAPWQVSEVGPIFEWRRTLQSLQDISVSRAHDLRNGIVTSDFS